MKKFLIVFVSLLMGVVIGMGVWHGIAYKDNLTSFVKDTWSKIESAFVNKDNVPSEEQKPNDEEPGQEEPGTEEPHVCELSEWNIVVEPTCDSIGQERRACDCGYYEERDILALGHDYVDGTCSRCGETDPNHVEEVSSLDGYYVNKNLLEGGYSRFSIVQIKENKYAGFVVYLKNNDPSTIYFPQDYLEYIDAESALSLVYEETDEIISIGISEYMEAYKDNEEYFNVYKNYLVFDKQTKKMTSTRLNGSVEMIKIDTFEILPYVEPRLNIEDNTLYLTDMTATDGTYTVYYLNSSTGEEGVYVAGNVAEFDLTVLFNHYPNLVAGDEYTISVVFETADGFLIQGYESIQYTAPNGEVVEHEHTFSEWGLLVSPTCTEIGYEQKDCSICGESEMREIPALGHTFDAGICTSCNALDEEFYNNFVGYWFTETTGFKNEAFSKYYVQVYKDGDNYIFTCSGYKVENGEIVLYQNSTDYSDPETWTFTSTNRIIEFTLTRQDITFNGTYDGQTLVVGDMTFTKTDKPIRYDGSTSHVTPL